MVLRNGFYCLQFLFGGLLNDLGCIQTEPASTRVCFQSSASLLRVVIPKLFEAQCTPSSLFRCQGRMNKHFQDLKL